MAGRDAVPALAAALLKEFVALQIYGAGVEKNNRKALYWTGTIWNVPKYTDVDASTAPTGNGKLITDVGVHFEGDPPSIVVMSVWEEAHQQKLKEMRLWLSHGPQTQVVVVLVWRIIPAPPGEESDFSMTPEVYDYTAGEPNKYKQRTSPTLKPLFGKYDNEYYPEVDRSVRIPWGQLFSTALEYTEEAGFHLWISHLIDPARALLKTTLEAKQPQTPITSLPPGSAAPALPTPTPPQPPHAADQAPSQVKPESTVYPHGHPYGIPAFAHVEPPSGYASAGVYGAYPWGGFLAYVAFALPISPSVIGTNSLTQQQILSYLSQSTQQLQSIAGISGAMAVGAGSS